MSNSIDDDMPSFAPAVPPPAKGSVPGDNKMSVFEFARDAYQALNRWLDDHPVVQTALDASGLSNYSGSYNYRNVRGATSLSCHAFGAALDIDAEHNPLGATSWHMPQQVVAAFKSVNATWGGDFIHRKDSQHFQFAHE